GRLPWLQYAAKCRSAAAVPARTTPVPGPVPERSENPELQAGGHGQAKFATLVHEFVTPVAAADHHLLRRLPVEPATDALDGPARGGAVLAGADQGCIRHGVGMAQQRIEAAVEEILERAGHVAEIFRGDEH